VRKIIPECPECGGNNFRVEGPASTLVLIRNPEGRWTDQIVQRLDWTEVPEVYCENCYAELPEDMATIVRFIAYNQLRGAEKRSSQDSPLIVPWSEVRVFSDASGKELILKPKEGGDQ
jgi:hypothetical protein